MMTHFVGCLDQGWETYAQLTGSLPKLFKKPWLPCFAPS